MAPTDSCTATKRMVRFIARNSASNDQSVAIPMPTGTVVFAKTRAGTTLPPSQCHPPRMRSSTSQGHIAWRSYGVCWEREAPLMWDFSGRAFRIYFHCMEASAFASPTMMAPMREPMLSRAVGHFLLREAGQCAIIPTRWSEGVASSCWSSPLGMDSSAAPRGMLWNWLARWYGEGLALSCSRWADGCSQSTDGTLARRSPCSRRHPSKMYRERRGSRRSNGTRLRSLSVRKAGSETKIARSISPCCVTAPCISAGSSTPVPATGRLLALACSERSRRMLDACCTGLPSDGHWRSVALSVSHS